MKFLQFLNTSLDELWKYQKENNYMEYFYRKQTTQIKKTPR